MSACSFSGMFFVMHRNLNESLFSRICSLSSICLVEFLNKTIWPLAIYPHINKLNIEDLIGIN